MGRFTPCFVLFCYGWVFEMLVRVLGWQLPSSHSLPVVTQPGTRCPSCSYARNHDCGKTTRNLSETLSKREIISLLYRFV